MGAFFADLFREAKIPCEIIEVDTDAARRQQLLNQARAVIVSVPIASTAACINELIPVLHPEALLADLTSVKQAPLEAMMKHSGEVLALHPMFGPGKNGIKGQTVAVCGGRLDSRAEALLQFLREAGAVLHELTASRHDQLMAVVQGMNHFHSIAFAHALGELGIPVQETIDVASPVYLLRMQLMGRILAQDAGLYADILLQNPSVPAALNAFAGSCAEFMQAISSGSREQCVEFFERAARSFGSYCEIALEESDEILGMLQSESRNSR